MADTKNPLSPEAPPAGAALPPDVAGSITGELTRRPRPVSRFLTETERTSKQDEYFWLDARAQWLVGERERLKLKYKQLLADLEEEMREVQVKKDQIFRAIRYGIIEEDPQPVIDQSAAARASAHTALVSASKELQPAGAAGGK